MPGLTHNPDDKFIRALLSLESRVAALENRSRRPTVGGKVSCTPSQSITPGSTYVVIDFASTVYDTGGVVDLGDNRLYAPVPGSYTLTVGNPQFTGSGGSSLVLLMGVMKNGAVLGGGNNKFSKAYDGSAAYLVDPSSYVLELEAGDYVQLYARTDGPVTAPQTGSGGFDVTLHRLHDVTQ